MDEIAKLKKELKEAERQKEIAELKKKIKETRNPNKLKKGIKDFFRPRGNEDEIMEKMMGW